MMMKCLNMYRFCMYGLLAFLLGLASCRSEEEKALREKISAVDSLKTEGPRVLSKAVIGEYRRAELAINRRYVREIEEVLSNDFEEKLNAFSDKEFGIWNSYRYMFKVLIANEEEWNDYWNLKKSKYFSTETTELRLHELYETYIADLQELRKKISTSPKSKAVPKEVMFNLQPQELSLSGMKEYSYANLAIEFGVDIAVSLIVAGAVALISLLVGCAKRKSWIVTVISIIVSFILAIYNDNRMISSIREQYKDEMKFDRSVILNQLDKATDLFYEYLSK